MSTLIARLAGPVQAWGAEPRLRTAGSHPTPTWSGLLGLARAALGHGRTAAPQDIAWLRDLTMAVRVDQPGTLHTDFQTINPLPAAYEKFAFFDRSDRGLIPVGTSLQATGKAPRWLAGEAPMVTRRQLIHDASFLWLVHGPDHDVARLAEALTNPRWVLALGRKGCTPSSPVLLGVHPGALVEAATTTPLTGRPPARWPSRSAAGETSEQPAQPVELVWLHGTPDPALRITATRVVLDNPIGSHPQDGHTAGQHSVSSVTAPRHPDLLGWALENLSHPARTSQEATAS